VNGLNNFNQTYSEYSRAQPLLMNAGGQRSRSQQAVEVAKALTLTLGRRCPSSSVRMVVCQWSVVVCLWGPCHRSGVFMDWGSTVLHLVQSTPR